MFPITWTKPLAPWFAVGLAMVGGVAVASWVDLAPKVETDFFFAEDDPQLQASRDIAERFPSSPQVILRAADLTADSEAYEARIEALTQELAAVEGVGSVYSISTDDPRSPLFGRILLTPDPAATNLIVQTDATDPEILLPRIEEVIGRHEGPDLAVIMSGVPVIVELIRRSLFRDLVTFSLMALLIFGALIAVVYRDPAVVVGTLATCLVSVSVTLLLTQVMGVSIGLLTANLVTIVFVLTLSHIVFLTGNWIRVSRNTTERAGAVARTLSDTLEGSFWSMTTTLLGFLSLLIATARPLRELGVAGAVGTVTAMAVAYSVYPAFLGRWARVGAATADTAGASPAAPPATRWPVIMTAGTVTILGLGLFRLDTDPGLLTYFAEGTPLRDGLEQVDADGGSSPLNVVVRDRDGGRLDQGPVYEKLGNYQAALEADSAVGVVLSPRVLLEHARTQPLAGFLSLEILLDLLVSPAFDRVGLGSVTEDRSEGLFFLRMRESVQESSRQDVIDRVGGLAREAGLEVVRLGGLYDLQAQLGRLIAASLRIGIGGLLTLFLLVAFVVSRSARMTAKMWICLAGIPLVVLGTFGHVGISVDIITSPAANIALAMGVDSMIHLVVRVRRIATAGAALGAAWSEGLRQIRGPVLAAAGTISAGFGIFVLSSFPPTRRFGLAVILGTATAALMALVVLPRIARWGRTETTPSVPA